jgi:hypothetical protein
VLYTDTGFEATEGRMGMALAFFLYIHLFFQIKKKRILGSHSGGYKDFCLTVYNAV